jgi:hypothetical protein
MTLKHLFYLLIGAGLLYLYFWIDSHVSPLAAVGIFAYFGGIVTCIVIYALAHQSLLGAVGSLKNVLAPTIKEDARVTGEFLRQQARTQGQYDRMNLRHQPHDQPPPQPQPLSEAEQFFSQHQQYRV